MIYSSNHPEYLCQKLCDNIAQTGEDIFDREIIVTQTAGMSAWLKTEISRINGVFANFSIMNQDSVMNEIHLLLFGKRPKNNKDIIRHKVYKLLDHENFKDGFPDVAQYYRDSEIRRIQLAARIADLFDQYQLYRADMIRLWSDDKLAGLPAESERWQQWLWKNLNIESREKSRDLLIEKMQENTDLVKSRFKRISLFGISIFTGFHLEFFRTLSEITQVDFYICLPTDNMNFQNELLLSYGSKASELISMVEEKLGKFEFHAVKNVGETSLIKLQNQILNNSNKLDFIDDGSLQINSCFTPAREVECLYNYLLDLFDKDRSLNPGDVLVMTTDINKYSPFIKAIFKNPPVKIPYWISGTSNNSEDTIVSAIEKILKFSEKDFTSEKVISLLEQRRIKQKFRISDCDYIRSVVRKANIRFGRENRAEDDSRYVSWKYGLEKIILGYAMLTDNEFLAGEDLTVFPFRDAEASQSHDLLLLKAFVETLESLIDSEEIIRTMIEWKDFLFNEVIEKMIYYDDFSKTDREELASISRALSYITSQDFEEKVPFPVFLDELNAKLFTETGEINLNTGNVTVSAPVPVRGIPFKVICFLGLDNDAFPREDYFMGFDLLGVEYQEGDRNKKETDKYLFLDTVLSAREKLYLSFIGQNVKDNTEIPPSIVVDTLLEYVGCGSILSRHPLYGFSSQYNMNADDRHFTFLYGEKTTGFNPKEPDPKEFDEISVYSFVKFFEHPPKWYFNNILGIYHEEDEQTLPETELFGLGHLEKWHIRNDLIHAKDENIQSYIEKSIKEGNLPLKNLGRLVSDEILEDISDIKSIYLSLTESKEEKPVLIDFNIENVRFTGTIEGVFGDMFITLAFSDRPVHKVRAYLRTLMLCAQGEISSSKIIEKKGKVKEMPVMKPEESKTEIKKLLSYFIKGTQAPLKFTVESTKPPSKNEGISIESILKLIESNAKGNIFNKPPIEPDKYLSALLEEGYFKNFDENDFEEFKNIALLLRLNTDQNEGTEDIRG